MATVEPDLSALDDGERTRAARLMAPEVSRRFVSSHVVLRRILALYVGMSPAALRFTRGEHGRPGLAGEGPAFNLSHSGDAFALAVADIAVGVDVEVGDLDDREDLDGMARLVMSPDELARFAAAPPDAKRAAFYDLWTVKEAVMKAMGVGPSRDARTVSVGWDAPLRFQDGERVYDIRRFRQGAGVPGAVALARPIGTISRWRWRNGGAEAA